MKRKIKGNLKEDHFKLLTLQRKKKRKKECYKKKVREEKKIQVIKVVREGR